MSELSSFSRDAGFWQVPAKFDQRAFTKPRSRQRRTEPFPPPLPRAKVRAIAAGLQSERERKKPSDSLKPTNQRDKPWT